MTQQHLPVIVVADDFTGANDAGSGLARYGARVNVVFDWHTPLKAGEADAWVINTDSRAVEVNQARARVEQAIRHAGQQLTSGWVFKKIDSTLRGNLGAEIEGALTASGKSLALIAPAVPGLGRTTQQGCCFIDGVLLTDTEYATDPKTPITTANILHRLSEQTTLKAACIPRDTLKDAQRLAQQIAAMHTQGIRLVVIDADSEDDLRRVVQYAAQLDEKPLLVGAAGLSDALSCHLYSQQRSPVLAVIGSMSETAQRQIAFLREHYPTEVIDIDIDDLFLHPGCSQRERWGTQVIQALRNGTHCVIRTVSRPEQRQEIDTLCQQYHLTRRQLGESISQFLGELTYAVLQQISPCGLYLSGGDVAIAIARRLGANGFCIKGQIANCVPYGYLLNCYPNMLVMTKAGGFGDEETLADVIRFTEGEVE
ncbi:serine kinase [Enterobacter cancerogenus]|uniref:Serine kinase n=1 Tax=Enterobacter cancerogenus TaxID=69218 RepID=A0AB38P3L1_9ENTR|nr:four-carbon acid sugar kinase family protein [Enterobacter cancerogenus]TKK17849.1 serine kinase [Enterobacter cancerogenus]